jgi:hypothetical protein
MKNDNKKLRKSSPISSSFLIIDAFSAAIENPVRSGCSTYNTSAISFQLYGFDFKSYFSLSNKFVVVRVKVQ